METKKEDLEEIHRTIITEEDILEVDLEWTNENDHFKILTAYNYNYMPVESFGNTTLNSSLENA